MTDLRVGFLGAGHINGVLRRVVQESRPHRVVGSFGRDDALPGARQTRLALADHLGLLLRRILLAKPGDALGTVGPGLFDGSEARFVLKA